MSIWSAHSHTQKGNLHWGLIVCSHHLKSLHNLNFESVFCKRNPMGQWSMCWRFGVPAHGQCPLLLPHFISRIFPQPPVLPPLGTWVHCWLPSPASAQGPSVPSRGLDVLRLIPKTVNMVRYHACDYVMLHDRKDFKRLRLLISSLWVHLKGDYSSESDLITWDFLEQWVFSGWELKKSKIFKVQR